MAEKKERDLIDEQREAELEANRRRGWRKCPECSLLLSPWMPNCNHEVSVE